MKSLWIVVLLMSAVCGAQEKVAKFSYVDAKGTICTCERDGFDAPLHDCKLAEGRTLSEMLNGLESGQRESYKREQEVLNKYFEEGHRRDAEWDANHPVKQADKKPKRDFSVNYLSGQAPLESRVEKLEQRVKELEAELASTQTGEAIRLAPGWTMHHIFVDGDTKEIGPICDGKNAPLTPKDKAKIDKAIQEIDQSATRKR